MTIQPGTDIGRYHILEQLGEGGMAVVYKAYDTRLETEVAVKVIRTERLIPEYRERTLKRFQIEAKKMAGLQHPNIVNVKDYGDFEGVPYLVLEYVPAGTLKERLGKPIPSDEAARLLIPVAQALAYAHGRGLVHRDVKPSNILITESGEPMLTDFGIAKVLISEETLDLTMTGMGVGTPEYMAPEQAEGKEIDARADIYSLGVIFYELVTGRKPFTADTPMGVIIKQIHDPLPMPSQYIENIPEEVERVLFKALTKDPAARYESMDDLVKALRRLAANEDRYTPRQAEAAIPGYEERVIPDAGEEIGKPRVKAKEKKPFGMRWLIGALGVVGIGLIIFAGIKLIGGGAEPQLSAPLPDPTPTDTSAVLNDQKSPDEFKVAFLTDGSLAASDAEKGFIDLGWDGCLMARDELGIEVTALDAIEYDDLESNVQKMAEAGYDLIVGGSFLLSDAVNAVAPDYPDTKFVVVEGYAEGDNLQNITIAANEGSFLVGAIAAGMSKTGTIAFIGGMEIPVIEAFEAGYIAGAKAIDPGITVLSGYIGNFTDVAASKELALSQFAQGGDVNYAVAGAGGFGAIEAAQEYGFYAIGVDTDMDSLAPGTVLTSMLKRVDLGVFEAIKAAYEGKFESGYKLYDLSDGGVGITEMKFTQDIIPAELLAVVDVLAMKIKNGEIIVPMTVAEANTFTYAGQLAQSELLFEEDFEVIRYQKGFIPTGWHQWQVIEEEDGNNHVLSINMENSELFPEQYEFGNTSWQNVKVSYRVKIVQCGSKTGGGALIDLGAKYYLNMSCRFDQIYFNQWIDPPNIKEINIDVSENKWYQIMIDNSHSQLSIFVDGIQVAEILDFSTYPGKFGFSTDPGSVIYFDDIQVVQGNP